MSYELDKKQKANLFTALSDTFDIYAPKRFKAEGRYSDTDIIKYDKINSFEEIEYKTKSDYPMKEVISPIQQTLFYFTEDEYRESKGPMRPILIFARACDINANHIQSAIYKGNGGYSDSYYLRMKEKIKFILLECYGGDENCFCVSMNTNITDDYSLAFHFMEDGGIKVQVKDDSFRKYFKGDKTSRFTPEFVRENELKVVVPEIKNREILNKLKKHPFWQEYNKRCISCGACTIACSTCTCFTQRDMIYGDNPEVGERRRVSASCQVDGFTLMAGGASFRPTAGDRMRYKILHKFHDYKVRFGRDMCVGCGRCTARCPEFISITHTLEKMSAAIKEIEEEESHD